MCSLRSHRVSSVLSLLLASTIVSTTATAATDRPEVAYDESSSSDAWGAEPVAEPEAVVPDQLAGEPTKGETTGPWFLESGRRLRVQEATGKWSVGTVSSVSDGVVQLALADTNLVAEVPVRTARVQAQVGESNHLVGGAVIGAVIGSVVGMTVASSGKREGSSEWANSVDQGFGLGLFFGGLFGGACGRAIKTPVWIDVYAPSLADGSSEPIQMRSDPEWMWDQAREGDTVPSEEHCAEVAFDIPRSIVPEFLRR